MLKLTDYITTKKSGLAIEPSRWTDIQHDRVTGPDTILGDTETYMADTMEAAGYDSEEGKELGREIFADLYEGDPMLSEKPQPWATAAMDIAKSIPEYDEMVAYTQGDKNFSAIGAAEILEQIAEQVINMRDAYTQHQEEQQAEQDAQQQGGQGQGEGEGQGQPQDGEGEGQGEGQAQGNAEGDAEGGENGEQGQGQPQGDGIREDGEQGEQGDTEGEGQAEWKPSEEQVEQMREAMRAAMKRTVEEIGELSESLRGAGMGDTQNEQDDTDRTEMIKKLQANRNLKRLLKMAGRIANMPAAKPAKTDDDGYDANGVTESGDIAAVLPSELALLADQSSEILLYKKIVEEKLLTVRRSGKKPLGRGDLILLVDESGSMRGDRHDMARAMAMASVLNMTKDKRNTTVIGYTSRVQSVTKLTKYRTAEINGRETGWPAAMNHLASRGCGGGTDFDPALRTAIEQIKSQPRADMIFLTDGDAGVSRSVLNKVEKLKKTKGLRITTVLIGGGRTPAVEAMSDTVIRVQDLTTEGAAKAIGAARKK